jgi:sulfite exporter TauE/SafE
METELIILLSTVAAVGFFHTISGPDHYLPFIMMAKAGKWSYLKTSWVTILCGLGHVGSSIVLGLIGVAFGIALGEFELFDSYRGSITAWLFITFGLIYLVYGVRKAWRNKTHRHKHFHGDGIEHSHTHSHHHSHLHVHEKKGTAKYTPWILFTIFVLGPCEPLIAFMMYPAAQKSTFGIIAVTVVFALITIVTMLSIVLISIWGFEFIPTKKIERYTHAIAGGTIMLCGLGIEFLGL